MLECQVCGCKFHAVVEKHYVARDDGEIGFTAALKATPEDKLYDAFDCPACGCQIIVKERKRNYIINKEKEK